MRMNISVPDDLKERMDAVREEVNWSALACRAFETKLGEVAASKQRKSMKDVVDRLRASKQASDTDLRKAGQEVGREWAKDSAEAIELEQLARVADHILHPTDPYMDGEARIVHRAIDPDEVSGNYHDFWENILGERNDIRVASRDFVCGFVEGAVEIWESVKDEL